MLQAREAARDWSRDTTTGGSERDQNQRTLGNKKRCGLVGWFDIPLSSVRHAYLWPVPDSHIEIEMQQGK